MAAAAVPSAAAAAMPTQKEWRSLAHFGQQAPPAPLHAHALAPLLAAAAPRPDETGAGARALQHVAGFDADAADAADDDAPLPPQHSSPAAAPQQPSFSAPPTSSSSSSSSSPSSSSLRWAATAASTTAAGAARGRNRSRERQTAMSASASCGAMLHGRSAPADASARRASKAITARRRPRSCPTTMPTRLPAAKPRSKPAWTVAVRPSSTASMNACFAIASECRSRSRSSIDLSNSAP